MNPLIIFPTPLDATCTLTHDTGGWTLTGVPALHPSGRPGQGFAIPANTPNGNGCQLTVTAPRKDPLLQRGILMLGTDPYLQMDDFHLADTLGGSAFAPVSIVADHFEAGGQRWTWRMTTGFCDYQVFLNGGDLRSLLKQNQDLGAAGRRVFLNMVNITDFNPDAYGDAFYARLPEFVALNAEYEQYVDFNVLPDSGYRGWNLAKAQNFWARVNDSLNGANWNHFRSLTNEFDHGGNLPSGSSPNDFARPGYALLSQGSAVSDAPPPRPGWGYREFHCAKDFPKVYLFEDMLFNGLGFNADGSQWGPTLPIVYSEGRRFSETDPVTDEKLAACYAHESLAFGCGVTIHTDDGKYSRLLGPRQASCVTTAMNILGRA